MAVAAVASLFAWLRRMDGQLGFEGWIRPVPYPVIMISPLLVACAAVTSLTEPFGDLERTLSSRLWLYRTGLMLIPLAASAAAFSWILSDSAMNQKMILRNLAAMTGTASFAAAFIGARLAWLPTSLLFMLMYLGCAGASLNRATFPALLWQWPLLPASEAASQFVAAFLILGIPLVCWRGPRELTIVS
jgi:hypothetical protein